MPMTISVSFHQTHANPGKICTSYRAVSKPPYCVSPHSSCSSGKHREISYFQEPHLLIGGCGSTSVETSSHVAFNSTYILMYVPLSPLGLQNSRCKVKALRRYSNRPFQTNWCVSRFFDRCISVSAPNWDKQTGGNSKRTKPEYSTLLYEKIDVDVFAAGGECILCSRHKGTIDRDPSFSGDQNRLAGSTDYVLVATKKSNSRRLLRPLS